MVASDKGYMTVPDYHNAPRAYIYICPNCTRPSFFDLPKKITPGNVFGSKILHITNQEIEKLYDEARRCFSVDAFTSTVMSCRKLLMNIAVNEGANEGLGFVQYVDYLASNNYVPHHARTWLDQIRILGNEANHKIDFKSKDEALLILRFTEMLLKMIYEMPGLLNNHQTTTT
jgi:hypothetical protein